MSMQQGDQEAQEASLSDIFHRVAPIRVRSGVKRNRSPAQHASIVCNFSSYPEKRQSVRRCRACELHLATVGTRFPNSTMCNVSHQLESPLANPWLAPPCSRIATLSFYCLPSHVARYTPSSIYRAITATGPTVTVSVPAFSTWTFRYPLCRLEGDSVSLAYSSKYEGVPRAFIGK